MTWVVRKSISSQREIEDVAGLFGLIDPDERDKTVREQMKLDSGADSTTFLKWVMGQGRRKKHQTDEYIRAGIKGTLTNIVSKVDTPILQATGTPIPNKITNVRTSISISMRQVL